MITHVHWWLVAVAFMLGMVLTFALMVRRVKGPESIPPTEEIPVAEEWPTGQISVAEEWPTEAVPVGDQWPTTKAPVAEGALTVRTPVLPYAPYGQGSARATPDGGGPAGWLVKGRSDTRLYYTPDDSTYDPIVAQVWFQDEESAVRAYFTPWSRSSRK